MVEIPDKEYQDLLERLKRLEEAADRQRAEDKLKWSEEYFRALIENSIDVVTIIDTQGIVKYQSPNYLKVWGRDPVGEIGKDLFKDVHPDDKKRVYDEFNYLRNNPGKTVDIEVRAQRGDGSWRWLEVSGRNLIGDQVVEGIVVNFRDITDRKRVENALKESEQNFKSLFINASDGMILAEPKTKKFVIGNARICHMLGYSPEEIKNLGVVKIHPEKDLPVVLEQFDKTVINGMMTAENLPVQRKDGTVFYADISSTLITIGGISYIMGIFRDVTEHKQRDEELAKRVEELGGLFKTNSDY
jgi:PAS domain S-box-containing protein